MRFHAECARCLLDGQMKKIESLEDESLRARYALRACEIIAQTDPVLSAAPETNLKLVRLRRELLNEEDDFSAEKTRYNRLLLDMYPRLRAQVDAAEDPVLEALKLSLAGNYIDFGVVMDVSEERFMELLNEAAEKEIDMREYANLCGDLARGGELVFVHDNCGEIVLDKLLIETIKERFAGTKVLCVVRETPILNDVTEEDAREADLYAVAEVVGNGMPDMGGTPLRLVPDALRERIEGANVIIAKGQGNFETMMGAKLNTYFLLLAKCRYYERWFGLKQFSAVLANDLRMEFE